MDVQEMVLLRTTGEVHTSGGVRLAPVDYQYRVKKVTALPQGRSNERDSNNWEGHAKKGKQIETSPALLTHE